MLSLLTILTLIAPILAAMLVYALARTLLSRWDRRAEAATVARRAGTLRTAEISATRSEPERARQVA